MKCPVCNQTFLSTFDKFSIEKLHRCVDCQKEWQLLPENDPENKKFEIEYSVHDSDSVIIFAKTEEDARQEFFNNYDEYEIDDIREIKKPVTP